MSKLRNTATAKKTLKKTFILIFFKFFFFFQFSVDEKSQNSEKKIVSHLKTAIFSEKSLVCLGQYMVFLRDKYLHC